MNLNDLIEFHICAAASVFIRTTDQSTNQRTNNARRAQTTERKNSGEKCKKRLMTRRDRRVTADGKQQKRQQHKRMAQKRERIVSYLRTARCTLHTLQFRSNGELMDFIKIRGKKCAFVLMLHSPLMNAILDLAFGVFSGSAGEYCNQSMMVMGIGQAEHFNCGVGRWCERMRCFITN